MTSAFPPAIGDRSRPDACPGALRTHPADDGRVARVRLPGGLLTVRQADELASLAEEMGDGRLDLTSRGNLQLRGLAERAGEPLAERLAAAGLSPSPAHERSRNIVASPLSGIDGLGHADACAWARRLDTLLCSRARCAGLSGRFLFALDDGRGDVAALGADVTLVARPDGTAELHPGPVGGGEVLVVPGAEAADWALRAAEAFLDLAERAERRGLRAWRVRDVDPDGGALTRLLAAAGAGTGAALAPLSPAQPVPGAGHRALCVAVPLGRVDAARWRTLAATAARGAGELRVTPWRSVVLPGLPADRAEAELPALRRAGFVTEPASPWHRASACTGRPGCARSLADVRADAAEALAADRPSADPGGLLPVHWSGCERRCGHPGGEDWVDVLATPDGYRVASGGTVRDLTPRQAPADVATARRTPPTRTM